VTKQAFDKTNARLDEGLAVARCGVDPASYRVCMPAKALGDDIKQAVDQGGGIVEVMEDGKCTHVVIRDDVYRLLIGQAQSLAETASRLLEEGLRDGHFGEISHWIAEPMHEVGNIEQFHAVTDRAALALSAATKANGGRLAFWTHDDDAVRVVGHLYYFALADRAPPPYQQKHVQAILNIAEDGTLAGVELIEDMPPPPTSPAVNPTRVRPLLGDDGHDNTSIPPASDAAPSTPPSKRRPKSALRRPDTRLLG
jgi:hypothetical protein